MVNENFPLLFNNITTISQFFLYKKVVCSIKAAKKKVELGEYIFGI